MKKGRFSLTVAWIFTLSGVLFVILGVLNGLGLLDSPFSSVLSLIGRETALLEGGWSLVAPGVFLLIEGILVFAFRMRKPFSMTVVPLLFVVYVTLQTSLRASSGERFASFIPEKLHQSEPKLFFLLFVLEVLLVAVLLASFRTYDEKWRKKRGILIKRLEKEGAIKSRETLEEEKALKRQQKLNEKAAREKARDEKRYSAELDRKAKAEQKKLEKERAKEQKEYEKKREKEELKREKIQAKEDRKKAKEKDRLLEQEEKRKEKSDLLSRKEEKKREKEEEKTRKTEEREEVRRKEEEIGPAPEYESGIGSPDTPLSFPSFEEMPDLKTIGHHDGVGNGEKALSEEEEKPHLVESSSFIDNLKSEIDRESWNDDDEEERVTAPAPDRETKLNTKHFREGGMLEATLEMYNSTPVDNTPRTPQRPIIGLGEEEEKKADNTESISFAPSSLDPSHPRYQMFRNLQTGVHDTSLPSASEHRNEEHIAPSNLDPSHPRYRMFEALQNGNTEKVQSVTKKEKEEDSTAPSYIGRDHPRYKLFEALKSDGKKDAETTVSYTPGRAFTAEDESEVKNPYSPSTVLTEEKPMTPVFTKKEEEEPQSVTPVIEEKPQPAPPLKKEEKTQSVVAEAETSSVPPVTPPKSEFVPPEMPKVRSVTEDENGKRVFETKSEEEVEDDFNLIVGVGDLASNRGGLTAIALRQKTVYTPPSPVLLKEYPKISQEIDAFTQEQGDIIVRTLAEQKISVELANIIKGPAVTMYELRLAQGMIISRITARDAELSYALGGKKVRILAPVPGKQAVGIEVPNPSISIIGFKDMIFAMRENPKYMGFRVPMILGRTVTGEPIVIDVAKMPHMIIAGTTGSGKSVCINSFINTILYQKDPTDVRLIMVDPKVVELTIYNGIPHLLTPVITDAKKAIKALEWLVSEMERRYAMMAHYGVRNIGGLNEKILSGELKGVEKVPYIVLILDEFADIMLVVRNEMDAAISRIAAKARAAGIHMILATQRPSSDVILGTLKSNLPGRIAFAVSSGINSRVILDENGAENLLGKGDMLLLDPSASGLTRIQGAFMSDGEVEAVTAFVTNHNSQPEFLEESVFEDPEEDGGDDEEFFDDDGEEDLYEAAKKIVYERKSASASYLQRRLKIGYNRAARIVEQMEEDGIVGPANGSKPREVLKFE